MSRSTLRILAYLALALASFTNGAEAGVVGSAGSWLEHLLPVQTAQFNSFGSNCYYADGWNGRGWYRCGDEWNNGFGWVGPFNNFGGPAFRRHHRHGFAVLHPRAWNPVSPGLEPSRRLEAGGAPSAGLHREGVSGRHYLGHRVASPRSLSAGGAHPSAGLHGVGAPAFHAFHGGPGFRHFGAGGVQAPSSSLHAGGAAASPGFGAGGFHGFGSGVHQFRGAGVPHIGAFASPGFTGSRFHGIGGAGVPHIGAPASPDFIGGGGLHGLGGATGVHIGAPVSRGFAGGGGFHGFGGAGVLPHRRARFARLCWRRRLSWLWGGRRFPWLWRGRRFPWRRRGVRRGRHRTSLSPLSRLTRPSRSATSANGSGSAHQHGDTVAVVEPPEDNGEEQVEQAEPDQAAADHEPGDRHPDAAEHADDVRPVPRAPAAARHSATGTNSRRASSSLLIRRGFGSYNDVGAGANVSLIGTLRPNRAPAMPIQG